MDQISKARAFEALHRRDGAFVIANPWDCGSARLLASLGFDALATSSAGLAFSLGRPDNAAGCDAVMRHVRELAAAVDLPVSADLENGFGDAPETVAHTIAQVAAAGAVGASIEDATQRADQPQYPLTQAVERIQAAVAAARALPFPFILTARAENYLVGHRDLDDTIRRLQAYQAAGADVLFAPGLIAADDIAAVVNSLERPVNVIMGLSGSTLSVADVAALGVKRISVGGSFARAALGALMRAAREVKELGTFNYAGAAAGGGELNALFTALEWPQSP